MMDYELLRAALDTACAEKVAQSDEDTNGYRYDACGKKMDGCGKGKGKGECKGKECDSCKKTSCDGCKVKDACGGKKNVAMDAAAYAASDIATKAAATIQQWAETDDLEGEESYADRLMAMFVGIADANKDGEITEDESDVIEAALNAGYDYLVSKGVAPEDAEMLLNEWDDDVADRVRDVVASELPDGEAADEDIDNFVFSDDEQEPAMDSVLDAVYKKAFAIRNGKKVKINKRISGTVRLTSKQKIAIRKAQMKSHSASALMRRMKSMKLRRRSGL